MRRVRNDRRALRVRHVQSGGGVAPMRSLHRAGAPAYVESYRTHYVWFQIVVPEVVALTKFGYVVNCP